MEMRRDHSRKKGNSQLEKGRLSKAVRQVMEIGVNWEDEWDEEDRLIFGELGKWRVADDWSMGEEGLAKERWETEREFIIVARVSKTSIALERSQIQPFPMYWDLAHPVAADHVA